MSFDAPSASSEAAAPAAEGEDELALDLSLGGPATDIDMAELAREFDLPGLSAAPEDTAPATELKDPLFDLDAMDFGLAPAPAAAEQPATPAAKDPLFDLDTMSFDLGAPAAPEDETIALHEQPAMPDSAMPRFDMSGIDLDLPATAGDLALPEVATVDTPAGDMSAAQMEMETKLDLAIAYQEIGDKEGARELLDEVIKGGSSEQVGKATAMRAKLA
jgi:pilus assembly protein FimV